MKVPIGLDSNVLVYLVNVTSPYHDICQSALEALIERGDQPVIPAQVLFEFWCVATRPAEVNGLGWSVSDAVEAIARFRDEFKVLADPANVLDVWLELVVANNLKGKRVHDAHLFATLRANGVAHLLTLNPGDFPAMQGLIVVSPLS